MRKPLFYLNLILFLIVWLSITSYTFAALSNLSLPYDPFHFIVFLIILDVVSLPLLWLWYKGYTQTIQLKTAVLASTILIVFYWGPFAPIHSLISLHLDALQLRWIAFVYIWEVVLVGLVGVYVILRITRFADLFLKGVVVNERSPEHTHLRIAHIPFWAAVAFTLTVFVGYIFGSFQLYYFSNLPLTEIIKNVINGTIEGIISSFIIFFLLEHTLRPALEKSGARLFTKGNFTPPKGGRSSLFAKIYAISALLVILSVGLFGTMAYGRSQLIVEQELKTRLSERLTLIKFEIERNDAIPNSRRIMEILGPHGQLLQFTKKNQGDVLGPLDLTQKSLDIFETYSGQDDITFTDRSKQTKIIGVTPLVSGEYLTAIVASRDFDNQLNLLLFHISIILAMIIAIVAMIGTLLARSITIPIKEIEEGSARIGRGDFSELITVYSNDELESLSNSLNETASKLRVSYAHLEEEIEDRTYKLAQANKNQESQINELNDITKQLMRREFDLQQANDALRKLDQAKTQFVSVAAHQLRTPLSVSKWTYQMLLSGDFGSLNNEQREVLTRGNTMNEQLINLVADLLDVARIESGKFDYKFAPADLHDFLSEMQSVYSQKAKEKNITFKIDIPGPQEVKIQADKTRLRIVFQNLIENALKFTPNGGRVNVLFTIKENMVEFRVLDTGIGIEKDELPHLFTKFFRSRKASVIDTGGTGLGLYIASSIVRAHNGKIWVESIEGQGSTFLFTIPYVKRSISI